MLKQTPQKRELFANTLKKVFLGVFAVILIITCFALRSQKANAISSSDLNFQARLENATGGIVPDGYYNIQFKLYNVSSGGSALWTESDEYVDATHDYRVRVADGYVSVNLGAVNAFPSGLDWSQQLWLTMNVGGNTTTPAYDGEMNPRLQLTAVPYAFQSQSATQLQASQSGHTGTLGFGTLSADQNILLPDASGTVCLDQSVNNCGYITGSAANNSYIQLQGSSPGTAQTGNFNINGTGIAATLNATTALQTAGVTRIDNSGNLTNVGNISASGTLQLSGTSGSSYIMSALGLGTTNPQTGSVLTIGNSKWISGVNSSGTGYVNMFQVNSNNQIQVGAALNISNGIVLPTDGGQLTFTDLPIDTSASAGTAESYTFRVGSGNVLTVYGEANGSGSLQNGRVAIGSSIAPAYTLDVGGDINASGSYRQGGTQGVTQAACSAGQVFSAVTSGGIVTGGSCTSVATGGTGSYIQNSTSQQTNANFNIAASSGVAATIQGASGQDIADFYLNGGATKAIYIDSTGLLTSTSGIVSTRTISSAGSGFVSNVTDSATSGTVAINGYAANLTGTATTGTNTLNGLNLGSVTAQSNNTFNGIYLGSNFTNGIYASDTSTGSLLNVAGTSIISGAGVLQSAGLSGTYSNQLTLSNASNNYSGANISLHASSGVAATIQGASGQDIIDFNKSSGSTGASINSFGQLTSNGAAISSSNSGFSNITATSTNTNTGASTVTRNNLQLGVAGSANSSGQNITNNILLSNVTTTTGNVFNGIYAGTGYDSILTYNGTQLINGTGILQSAALSGTYSNVLTLSNTGNVYSGASATLSGTIQGATVNATSSYKFNGTAGATTTCSGGQFLQNQVVQGGIVTGGTCATVAAGGVTTVGALDGGTANANGATISGATIYLQSASASFAGLVNTGTQTFAGAKTFNGTLTAGAGVLTSSLDTASAGTLTIGGTNATGINLNQNTTFASGMTVSIQGALTNSSTYNGNTFTSSALTFSGGSAASIQSASGQNLGIDAGSSGALNLGTTNATGVNIGKSSTTTTVNGALVAGTTSITGSSAGSGTAATINTGATSNVGLLIQGAASQTANLLQIKANGVSNPLFNIGATGAAIFRNSTNSGTAFQIQNSVGNNILSVSTDSGAAISLGHAGTGTLGYIGTAVSGIYTATSTGTETFSFAKGVPAGHTLLGTLVVNATSGVPINVSDSKGNTYTTDASVVGSASLTTYTFSGVVTTPLTTSDTLTLTLSSGVTSRWAVDVEEFDNILTSSAKDQSTTNSDPNSASMNTGTTGTTTSANEVIFGGFGYTLAAPRSFTPGSGYTSSAQQATNTGSFDRAVSNTWKIVSATGTQTETATLSGNSAWGATLVTYKANAPDLGAAGSISFNDGTANGFTSTIGFDAGLSGNHNIYIPDADGTICLDSGNCSSAGGYIVNGTGLQTGNFNISGTGAAATLHANTFDTSSAGTLALGSTNATAVTITPATTISNTLNVVSGYKFNGTSGSTTTCSSGQFLQNQVVQGGITTGGSCASAVTTVGSLDGGTANATGATISANTIYLQSASSSFAGLVNTTTQTLAGAKTFSGTLTASATGGNALAITGAPTNSATSSLIQIGNAIQSGNTSTNGGTYIGLNAPSTGAGSAADFLNFQLDGSSVLKIDSAGDIISSGYVNATGGYKYGGTAGSTTTCSSGNVLQNAVVQGGIITGGTCVANGGGVAPTLQDAYNNSGTTDPQIQLSNANGGLKLRDAASSTIGNLLQIQNSAGTSTYFAVTASGISTSGTSTASSFIGTGLDTASAGSLTLGGSNATSISIGNSSGSSSASLISGTGGTTLTSTGSISIGTSTATSVNIGRSGATTTVAGTGYFSGTLGVNNSSGANPFSVNTPATTQTGYQAVIGTGGTANNGLIIQGVSGQNTSSIYFGVVNGTGSNYIMRVYADGNTRFGTNTGGSGGNVIVNTTSLTNGGYAKEYTAGTGGISANDVVVLANDGGTAHAMDSTTAYDPRVLGVSGGSYAAGISADIYVAGTATVNYTGTAPAIGDQLVVSSVSGAVKVDNNATQGIVGYATTAGSGGTVGIRIQITNGQANPSFSGSVTVGSTITANALNVGSSSQYTVDASGNFTTSGKGTIQTTNATAFSVQNAGGSSTYFNVDTSGGTITLGSSASGNYITVGSSGLTAYGTARHTKTILLTPEFAGAVLDAQSDTSGANCSANNSGTMTSGYDSTNRTNYYDWTASNPSTAQCYDVVVQVPIPSDFDGWASSNPINIQLKKDSTGTAAYAIRMIKSDGTDDTTFCVGGGYCNPGTISTSWGNMVSGASLASSGYTAGDYLTLRVRMTSTNGANVYLGNISLSYNSKF